MNETKKSSFFHEMVRPFLVLVIICLVTSALLGVTHYYTEPVIEANAAAEAEETRKSVLPAATAFTEVEVSADAAASGVQSIYKDEGGSGYVITAVSKGYKGDVTVTIGFDASGAVAGIHADVSSETQGVGSKAGDDKYLSQFTGLTGSADSVDTISGATYSSTAVRRAVNAAMAALAAIQ